jgi:adenylosuccinate lyase
MEHAGYTSPFSWRYGSPELRRLFSEHERRRLWRRFWVELAASQRTSGLVTQAELADIEAHAGDIDIPAALAIEREIGHDLMAEIRVFASQATVGGGKIHLGATSMDVEDTVEIYRLRAALAHIARQVRSVLTALAAKIERYADLPCIAFTHLQPAEPTTLGYRFAIYAQDLYMDDEQLRFAFAATKAKGVRGAVGTSASYGRLLDGTGRAPADQERDILDRFGLEGRDVSTQTYPRKTDYLILTTLAGIGASLSKLAADVRILASPPFGEIGEPFGAKQVGSSAMPFKRNPILSERIDSLARLLPGFADVAWQNAATNFLERTLDDSANRRTILPEAFLCTDELLNLALRIIEGLRVDEKRIAQNLRVYGAFAGSEAVMMEAAKAGGDRQALHEAIREAAMTAHEAVARGGDNPLSTLLVDDERLTQHVDPAEIRRLLDPVHYVGDAPARARAFAKKIAELPPLPDAGAVAEL